MLSNVWCTNFSILFLVSYYSNIINTLFFCNFFTFYDLIANLVVSSLIYNKNVLPLDLLQCLYLIGLMSYSKKVFTYIFTIFYIKSVKNLN